MSVTTIGLGPNERIHATSAARTTEDLLTFATTGREFIVRIVDLTDEEQMQGMGVGLCSHWPTLSTCTLVFITDRST